MTVPLRSGSGTRHGVVVPPHLVLGCDLVLHPFALCPRRLECDSMSLFLAPSATSTGGSLVSRGAVRLIQFNFNGFSSGSSTPRRSPTSHRPSLIEDDFPSDLLLKASAQVFPDPGEARAREARRLESRIARVTSKKCSVEEVSTALQKEVDCWLTEVTTANPVCALSSSSRPSLILSYPQSSALFFSRNCLPPLHRRYFLHLFSSAFTAL